MGKSSDRFLELERAILAGRAFCTLSEDEEDGLVDEMDGLWIAMTQQERDEANRRSEGALRPEAPEALVFEDRATDYGSPPIPRAATSQGA